MCVGELKRKSHEALVDRHDRARIVKLPAIVGSAEDGDELPVGEELVPVLDHLVRANHEVKVVLLQKLGDHVGAESVRDAAVVLRPPTGRGGEGGGG